MKTYKQQLIIGAGLFILVFLVMGLSSCSEEPIIIRFTVTWDCPNGCIGSGSLDGRNFLGSRPILNDGNGDGTQYIEGVLFRENNSTQAGARIIAKADGGLVRVSFGGKDFEGESLDLILE